MPTVRATIATFSALAVAVLVVVALFVWPGFLVITHCEPSQTASESIHGRTYCYASVPISHAPGVPSSYTIWEFSFRLVTLLPPGYAVLNISVTEPNGTSYSGGLIYAGGPFAPPQNFTTMWFAPDDESGVTTLWGSGNASLLVEN